MVEPRHALIVLLGGLLCLAGCATPGKSSSSGSATRAARSPALARLGTRELTEADFERFLETTVGPDRAREVQANPQTRQTALEDWLDREVQLAKARQEGIDRLPNFLKAVELMEMKLLVRRQMDLNRKQLIDPSQVPPAEIESYYDSRTNLFQVPEGVRPGNRQPLDEVRGEIAAQIAAEKNAAFNQAFIARTKQEFHFRETPDARPEAPLMDVAAVPTNAVIAWMGSTPIREIDFRWFLRDAFRAEQRASIFSQPGARARLLEAFFHMRLMEAQARQSGLGDTAEFKAALSSAVDQLLVEFLQEREGSAPWKLPGATEAERAMAFRRYMDGLREEMKLQILPEAAKP